MDGWMDEWTDGWIDGQMDGRTDEWTDGWPSCMHVYNPTHEWHRTVHVSRQAAAEAFCDAARMDPSRMSTAED